MIRSAAAGGGGLAALGLVGCGDDDKPKATPTAATGSSPAAGTATSRPATSATAAPTKVDLTKLSDDEFFKAIPTNLRKDYDDKDIKPGGRFTLTTPAGIGLQDALAATDQTRWTVQVIYNTLLRAHNHQGMENPQVRPVEGDLAQKWERPDPSTMVFTLWPNVKFQNVAPVNGRAMTVDDIKYSLDRAKSYAKSTAAKGHNALFESVEAVGTNQVKVKLSRPDPVAEQFLTYQRAMCVIPKEIGDSEELLAQKPIGTGAFIQKSFTPNVDIVYDKNPDYFKKDAQGRQLPYADGHRVLVVRDVQQHQGAFLTDQAEYMQAPPLADLYGGIRDFYRQGPNMTLQRLDAGWGYIVASGKWEADPAWRDIRVRRGLNMLIPRDQMSKTFFRGAGGFHVHYPWAFHLQQPPPLADMGKWFQFDPKEAKALLDAAGVGNREWTLEYYEGSANIGQQMIIFQQEAAKAGVKINLNKNPDYVTILGKMGPSRSFDLSLHHHTLLMADPINTIVDFVTGQPENTSFGRVDDAKMKEYYAKLQATPIGPERLALGKEIMAYQNDQVFELQFVVPTNIYIQSPKFKNWVNTGWAANYHAIMNFDSVWLDQTKTVKG